jgi:hypothetical protein
VGVSKFTFCQILQVREFIGQFGSRVFIIGGYVAGTIELITGEW